MVAGADLPASVGFGRFRVLPHRREMIADGTPIQLGGRTFDILMTLIEARGAVITKDALMAQVWPGRVVEEHNLQSHISALRAALGPDRNLIRTVSGRGYQFTGEIRVVYAGPAEPVGVVATQAISFPPPTNVPEPVSELIGREEDLSEILNLVTKHRLVTLAGAGGIGKTTLALALARELRPHFVDGVWLAEFSALADPALVPATVAAAVGLELDGGEASAQRVAQALAGRHLLLVLDTCEHVIDAVAAFAEAVLGASSTLHVVATSRESLRAGGERVYPLQPLAVPPMDVAADDDLLRYGAVRLFIDRVRARDPRFSPDQRLVATIGAICRRLDGIPLAIELAAARVATLGIEELAARLDDRFRLLVGGRRTALPRQQALRATLDWSYELLTEPEREILQRLAVFAGAFTIEGVRAVVTGPELSASAAVDGTTSLIAKSLIQTEVVVGRLRYRLLDTTREYALEKLEARGGIQAVASRHASYYRDFLEPAEEEERTLPAAEWLALYGWHCDNVRAALDWAFSPEGDTATGIALTAAAIPLWMHLSLLTECRDRSERALAVIGASLDASHEMKLGAALGASLQYQRGAVDEVSAAYRRAIEIAESLNDAEYRLRSLWGLWGFHLVRGQWRVALEYAQRLAALAVDDPGINDRAIADRVMCVSLHYHGDQAGARRHVERMLTNFAAAVGRPDDTIRFHFDQRVVGRSMLGRILWLQGFPDQARRTAETAVETAREVSHAVSLCFALDFAACPVMLWAGDLAAAEHYIAALVDHSARYALPFWGALGRTFLAVLLIRRGAFGSGLGQLRVDLDNFSAMPPWIALMFLNEMAAGFARAGEIAYGLAAAERAIERAERTEALWQFPESLRIKGELLLSQAATRAENAAEDHFRQALDTARRQGALSFELRAATSLARLWRDQGRPSEAHALLQPVYDCFTEGFDTADLKEAKLLLGAL